MKEFQSTVENIWYEIIPVELTEQQISVLQSTETTSEIIQEKQEIHEMIKALREQPVSETYKVQLDQLYAAHKPQLKENDTYQLISIDASEFDNNEFHGILNCRVNGDHIQVRF